MDKTAHVIHIDPDSELARALAKRAVEPLHLESGGARFRVVRAEDDLWADYDLERVRAGLRRFAGLITPEDAERIKESIYRGREEGTRPPDRP